jgi:hypothetical protein
MDGDPVTQLLRFVDSIHAVKECMTCGSLLGVAAREQ